MPRLTARAKESAAGEISNWIWDQEERSHSAVPSSEPLSTTMISEGMRSSSRMMPGICASRRSFPLREGMTTEIPAAVLLGGQGDAMRHERRSLAAIRAAEYQNASLVSGFKV